MCYVDRRVGENEQNLQRRSSRTTKSSRSTPWCRKHLAQVEPQRSSEKVRCDRRCARCSQNRSNRRAAHLIGAAGRRAQPMRRPPLRRCSGGWGFHSNSSYSRSPLPFPTAVDPALTSPSPSRGISASFSKSERISSRLSVPGLCAMRPRSLTGRCHGRRCACVPHTGIAVPRCARRAHQLGLE